MITVIHRGNAEQQQVKDNVNYRFSKYTIRVKHKTSNYQILYNTYSNCIVILDNTSQYKKFLVNNWFLVENDFNEYELANVFKTTRNNKIYNLPIQDIDVYTIATTTNCNANCWYCTEVIKNKFNMTDDIAVETANFIVNEYKKHKKPIKLRWFGGEPLYNTNPINIISKILQDNNVKYHSIILSNGYLANSIDIQTYKNLWKTNNLQITLDGINEYYNAIKNYIYTDDKNPFETVIKNIGILINNGIKVSIRLNVSLDNKDELINVIDYLYNTFGKHKNLYVYCIGLFQLMEENPQDIFPIVEEIEQYIKNKFGFYRYKLQIHKESSCFADNGHSLIINPFGKFTLCDYNIDGHTIGDVKNGIKILNTNDILKYRKQVFISGLCEKCVLYPSCIRLENCAAFGYCNTGVIEYETKKLKRSLYKKLNDFIKTLNKKEE